MNAKRIVIYVYLFDYLTSKEPSSLQIDPENSAMLPIEIPNHPGL